MKSLILTYVILGLLLNVGVWWATEVSAQGARQSWRSDIYSETTNPRGGVSGPALRPGGHSAALGTPNLVPPDNTVTQLGRWVPRSASPPGLL